MNQTPRSRRLWLNHSVAASAYAPDALPAGFRRGLLAKVEFILGLRLPPPAPVRPVALPEVVYEDLEAAPASVPASANARHAWRFQGPTGYLGIHQHLNPR